MNYIFNYIINDDFKNKLIKLQILINKYDDNYNNLNKFINCIFKNYYITYNYLDNYCNNIFSKIKNKIKGINVNFYKFNDNKNYINIYCPWLNNSTLSNCYFITKKSIKYTINLLLLFFKIYKELNVFYYFNKNFFDKDFFDLLKKLFYQLLILQFTKCNYSSYLLWEINKYNINNISPYKDFWKLFNNYNKNNNYNIMLIFKNIYNDLNLIIPKSLQNEIFNDNIINNTNKIILHNINIDIKLELLINKISNNNYIVLTDKQFNILNKYYSLEYYIKYNTLDGNINSPIVIDDVIDDDIDELNNKVF